LANRYQDRFNLPSLPSGDEEWALPPPPPVQPAGPPRKRQTRPRKNGGARAQFLAGVLGGVAFVLTPTLVLAGHLAPLR
jgi:hypothetical protein